MFCVDNLSNINLFVSAINNINETFIDEAVEKVDMSQFYIPMLNY